MTVRIRIVTDRTDHMLKIKIKITQFSEILFFFFLPFIYLIFLSIFCCFFFIFHFSMCNYNFNIFFFFIINFSKCDSSAVIIMNDSVFFFSVSYKYMNLSFIFDCKEVRIRRWTELCQPKSTNKICELISFVWSRVHPKVVLNLRLSIDRRIEEYSESFTNR